MKSAGKLVAVIASTGDLYHLQRALGGALNSLGTHLAKVIVVDNGAEPAIHSWLADQRHPRLELLTSEGSATPAALWQAGADRARQVHGADWLLFCDERTSPLPGAIAAFHNRDRSGSDIWVPASYTHGGHICADMQPRMNPIRWPGAFKTMALSDGKRGLARAVLGTRLSGTWITPGTYSKRQSLRLSSAPVSGMLISASALDRFGPVIADPAGGGRSQDWSRKARKAGARISFAPEIGFTHIGADLGGLRDLIGGVDPRPLLARLRLGRA